MAASNPDANIASHVSAAVALGVAVVSALHPGFTLPDGTTVASISLAVAGVIESINTFFHKSNAAKLAVVKALAEKAVAEQKPLA